MFSLWSLYSLPGVAGCTVPGITSFSRASDISFWPPTLRAYKQRPEEVIENP
jgi:hypothetical protein